MEEIKKIGLSEVLVTAYRNTKWWQFRKKKILSLAITARYFGITGRPEKEKELLDKAFSINY